MNLEELRTKINRIEACAGDDEIAHGMEDELMREFISYIAAGGVDDIQYKASQVLTTANIDFQRWCA
jgi:hypothetical protein